MSLPQPCLVAGRRAVRRVLEALPVGSVVVVGCSGGADSLALAACVAHETSGPRAGRQLVVRAVVVDHGMQTSSAEVAQDAAATCERLGLTARVVRVDVGTDGGPEAAARAARYAALEGVLDAEVAAAGAPGGVVLVGHTRDDQAETVLLGLARGAGARSLAGMRPERGRLRRPFLGLTRADTEGACAELGLDVWHDPTNLPAPDGGGPLRSLVRHRVLPVLEDVLGPGVPAALARTAEQLREDDDALTGLAVDLLARAAGGPQAEGYDVATLAAAPAAVRRRALRAAAVQAGSLAGALTRTHVLALEALLVAWRGQGAVPLPGRVEGTRSCGRLVLHARSAGTPAP